MCAPNLSKTTYPVPTCEHRPKLRRRPSPTSVTATSTSEFSTTTSSSPISTKKTKAVTFGATVAVRLIPTHQELTHSQYIATYYTAADLETARTEGLDDIRALRAEEPEAATQNDFAGPCYRGIEHLVSRESKLDRTERRRAYVHAVLIEQYRQVANNGYADINDLATVAKTKSHNDKIVARSKGMADEDVMKDILGRRVVQKARALSTTGKAAMKKDCSQRKLAFITGAVRNVRIGSVKRENYAVENARSA